MNNQDADRLDPIVTLALRLKLHAHELVNGGANAGQLRADLFESAEALIALEAQCATQAAQLRDLLTRWQKAELDMRVLHGGLPGSGYDKLADGYGTCVDELMAALAAPPKEPTP